MRSIFDDCGPFASGRDGICLKNKLIGCHQGITGLAISYAFPGANFCGTATTADAVRA